MPKNLPLGYRITAKTIERPSTGTYPYLFKLQVEDIELLRQIERFDQDLQRQEVGTDVHRRLLRDALARNAYGTASIEGNPLTLDDVESLLAKGITPSATTLPVEREILRHAELFLRMEGIPLPKKVGDVEALHRRYFSGILDEAGRLKTRPNYIGQRTTRTIAYVPTSPAQTPKELQRLLDWCQEAPEHPLVKAAVFFHEFQSIHPFLDGNGRLGRFLTGLLLWHWGYKGVQYALLDYVANLDREGYYKALDAGRGPRWDRTPWISYYLRLVQEAYRLAFRRLRMHRDLPPHINDRQARVVDWIVRSTLDHPRLRFKLNDVHAAFPETPRRTLTYDLGVLVDARVLERRGERKATTYGLARDRTYLSDPGHR